MAIKKGVISKIHVAKFQLGLDDETYRAVLKRLTGKTSSKELTDREIGRVLAYFRENGFVEKPHPKTKGKPHNFDKLPPLITKIEALLADMKLDWRYADRMAKHMYKVERVAWIKKEYQLEGIIAALYYKQQKALFMDQINKLFAENNTPAERKAQLLNFIKGGDWSSRKEKMEQVIEVLTWEAD